MSVFWLFVLIVANAWTLGLYLLPRLHRQTTGLVSLFVGGLFGALNFALGGAIHARAMASDPVMSMAVAFGIRWLLFTTIMTGFYRRPTGRGARVEKVAKWSAAALGGLYVAVISLGIEVYVRASDAWATEELFFRLQSVLNLSQ